ncbi:DUF4062 domain-containing protein [Streptomyces rishiriensis]|uniref:DUF4062 domain-containing protein n=1 Tax=Streptomyces rishiriensis TaxID=68264 RepID=UPI000D596345|nr:DUF4062 domain-containing protein [Streptomyces rishiriensis]
MKRRYQVFVSSTYTDLKDERRQIIQALLELGCIPAGMEMFPAADEEQWELIKRVIDESDYYVVIVGNRYGTIGDAGLSYTEQEYDYAVSQKKAVLGFLHAEPSKIEVGKSELDSDAARKLESFRRKIKRKPIRTWRTPGDLNTTVTISLVKAMEEAPAEGWVRARHAATPELIEELNSLRASVANQQEANTENSAALAKFEALMGADEMHDVRFKVLSQSIERSTGVIAYQWRDLFLLLGSCMMDEVSDGEINSTLANHISDRLSEAGRMPDFFDRQIRISRTEWDTIKVRFRALELIEKGTKKRAVSDKNCYWKLTSHGELQLMRMTGS